jgi:hypothetical protein
MSNLKDYVQDLVKNVISTGFFEKIKITASAKDILIEAIEKDKDVVLKGKFAKPLTDLNGNFGLSNLTLLSHIISDSEFSSEDSKLEVVYDKVDPTVPNELSYENKSKSYINYRFMSIKLIPDQPKFAEPVWDVVIKPTKASIQQFGWAAAGLSAYEQYFTPAIKDGELRFYIGEDGSANQRGGVVFASNRTEKFDSQHKWKISHMQAVLKLAESTDCEMAFSNKGAIQIKVNTGVGEYKFIFPAKVK